MKREGHLLERIAEWNNLRVAFAQAARGRRHQRQVHRVQRALDGWIADLGREIRAGSVQVGGLHSFVIREPKRRVIHAAPFRERVLHHAIMNVAAPVFERLAIDDSYACRPGKGSHAARRRAQALSRRATHCLAMDIRGYFASVSHAVLDAQLVRLFKDVRFLDLLRRIIRSFETVPGRGLPIGSLVSQYLANAYLAPLDRYVLEHLSPAGYVRYMDDFLVYGEGERELEASREEIANFCAKTLRLDLKPGSVVRSCRDGVPFLGVRVTPTGIYPTRRLRRRVLAAVERSESEWASGRLSAAGLQRRVSASVASLAHTRCGAWRMRVLQPGRSDA